jgi:DNA polymerase III alpha subunit (gram-positive type)
MKKNAPPFVSPVTELFEGNFVTFDHETSSLQEDCEVLQIACKNDKYEFSCYIQPTKTISKMSSSVTGLTNGGGILFHNGQVKRNEISLKSANRLCEWSIANRWYIGYF